MSDGPSLIRDFAHELRNAISPIRSAADVLRVRGASDPAVLDKALQHIRRSLDAALQTIDVFVAADRAMSGTLTLDPASRSLAELIDEAIVHIRAIDTRETPRFRVAPLDTPLYVNIDREQATTVLSSLLEHARASCAADGDIDVVVEREAGHVKLRVRFPVANPAADVASAFDTFRAPPGMGLMALRTARQIAELQQGALTAHEDTGSGVREFVLTFTRGSDPDETAGSASSASRDEDPAPSADPAAHAGGPARLPLKILLVDDNLALRTTYTEALTELGYDVIAAGDGDEAVKLAKSRRPDVALIDIHLPTVNGYQVARTLKSQPQTRTIRLVMLSGMTLDETTRRLSLNAGFDDCIDKMAGPSALDALLHAT